MRSLSLVTILPLFILGCSSPSQRPSPSPTSAPVSIELPTTVSPTPATNTTTDALSTPAIDPTPKQYVPYEDDYTRDLKTQAAQAIRLHNKSLAFYKKQSREGERLRNLGLQDRESLDSMRGAVAAQKDALHAIETATEAERQKFECWYKLGLYLKDKDRQQAIQYLKLAANGSKPSDWQATDWEPIIKARKLLKKIAP